MSPASTAAAGRAVLVTGATGLVGTELMDQLQERGATEVVGVSRRGSPENPDIVAWDMATERPPACLRRRWDAIVNTAANTRWSMNPEEALAANVSSVRALKPLAGTGTHVIHVSTTYARGLRGSVDSSSLSDYRNTYEWSKAYAERVAREYFAGLTVVRPPLIVGRRDDGRAARFSGMYTMIRGVTVGTVPAVVADSEARFDAIPVDELCWLLADLAIDQAAGEGSVQTIAGGDAAPTVREAIVAVVSSLNRWREEHDRQPVERPRLVSPESWNRFLFPFVREHLTPRQLRILELLRSFEPYLALADPIRPDFTVEDALPCLETSTRYWAETNPRIAALAPKPWRGPKADRAAGGVGCPR